MVLNYDIIIIIIIFPQLCLNFASQFMFAWD